MYVHSKWTVSHTYVTDCFIRVYHAKQCLFKEAPLAMYTYLPLRTYIISNVIYCMVKNKFGVYIPM